MSLESDGGIIYWQGKTEELGEKPIPLPLCPPQIPHGITRARTRASAVRGRRLTTWAMVRHASSLYSNSCQVLRSISSIHCCDSFGTAFLQFFGSSWQWRNVRLLRRTLIEESCVLRPGDLGGQGTGAARPARRPGGWSSRNWRTSRWCYRELHIGRVFMQHCIIVRTRFDVPTEHDRGQDFLKGFISICLTIHKTWLSG
jgi:hypothetical protein